MAASLVVGPTSESIYGGSWYFVPTVGGELSSMRGLKYINLAILGHMAVFLHGLSRQLCLNSPQRAAGVTPRRDP